jgi:hypothetical protein
MVLEIEIRVHKIHKRMNIGCFREIISLER